MADRTPFAGIRVHLGYFGSAKAPGEPAAIKPRLPAQENGAGAPPPVAHPENVASSKRMDDRIRISLNVG